MTEQESRFLNRSDWLLVGLLLALVLPLRLWLLCNTEVTARDSVGYIRYALQFEQKPWTDVLEENHQHPGYPMCIWLMSLPVRALAGETTPENMALAAQLVSLLASLVLIMPMYVLGRQFFDRPVSFAGTLLYQYLPISAHHLSDGISEPIFLVLLVSSLYFMVRAIGARLVWASLACGLFAGTAYLIRPEGLLIVPAFVLTLAAVQLRSEWRSSWRRFIACGAAMLLTAALVGSIYVYATGRITNKLSAIETIKNLKNLIAPEAPASATAPAPGHLVAASYAPTDSKAVRLRSSVWALVAEINQGFHYIAGVPAILGLWWSFGVLRRQAGFWALGVYTAIHCFILVALAMSVFYVSDRHVMILVLVGGFFAASGLRELPRRMLTRWPDAPVKAWYRSAPVWFTILFAALIGACLPKATERLHGNREGNRAAGLWLAQQAKLGDHIEDDHAWSIYFSGFVLKEAEVPVLPRDYVPTCYIVTTRSRHPEIDARRQAAAAGQSARVVYRWPEDASLEDARVLVYAQPRDRHKNPWNVATSP